MFRQVSRRRRKGLGEQGPSHRRRATLFCHPNNTLMQSRATNEGKPLYINGSAANCVRGAGFR
jgi:hypothetical protein